MSSPDKPKPPEVPFLRDDEIGSELDAWDSTFDALHDDPETGTRLPRAAAPTKPPDWQSDAEPFADRDDAPSRLRTQTGDYDEDAMLTPIPAPEPGDEVGIYSSAPRPSPAASPMPPLAPKRTAPAIVRRAMSNTARQPVGTLGASSPENDLLRAAEGYGAAIGPGMGSGDSIVGGGSIRSSSDTQTEIVSSSRDDVRATSVGGGASAVDDPASAIEEDDYADMEIGGEASVGEVGIGVEAAAPRRTVAHVVRRSASPSNPPPAPAVARAVTATGPVSPVAFSAPVSGVTQEFDEADFSDVAAAALEVEPLGLDELRDGDGMDEVATQPALRRSLRTGSRTSDAEQSDDEILIVEPSLRFDAIRFPEQIQPLLSSQLDEQLAQALLMFERELELNDTPALRIEVARLLEHFGDFPRAREHYDAAVRADPRQRIALRGLRRVARVTGDTALAAELLETEMALAGPLEQKAMRDHHIALLLDSGDHDKAHAAVNDALASSSNDVRALIGSLELAALEGGVEELSASLERLASTMGDSDLRASLLTVRSAMEGTDGDHSNALASLNAAIAASPDSYAARLYSAWHLAATSDREATAAAQTDLAHRLAAIEPALTGALAMRARNWQPSSDSTLAAIAAAAAPGDAVLARFAAEVCLSGNDPVVAANALAQWAKSPAPSAERAYAASRAAELDPDRGVELWRLAFELSPTDDYAAAQLRTALIADGAPEQAIEVDRRVAAEGNRERVQLRSAFGLMGEGDIEDAISILERGHRDHPESYVLTEALAEALASAGRWVDRARLLAESSAQPSWSSVGNSAQLRSAVAWEEAVGAVAATPTAEPDEVRRITEAALGAWQQVLALARGGSPAAHAAAIVLAMRLGDSEALGEVLSRAQHADRSPWSSTSLALRRARLLARQPATETQVESVLREGSSSVDDPRRTLWQMLAATRRKDRVAAATILDDRAAVLGATPEAAALRLRAAPLALDGGDSALAAALVERVEQALPTLTFVAEALAALRRKAGESRPPPSARRAATVRDEPIEQFVQVMRDADLADDNGESDAAIGLYQKALELRRGDPFASHPLVRLALAKRDATQLTAFAVAQLRDAETAANPGLKAELYQWLARIDSELRDDVGSAQIALESALQADPSRLDVMLRLQREYAKANRTGDQLRLRRAEHDLLPLDLARDRAALAMDAAGLADLDRRPSQELADLYRIALEADPRRREALFHLEASVRAGGNSLELAQLDEQVARYYDGDTRTQAAFYTRAGEILAEIGQTDVAVQKFAMAAEVVPGHVPALEGWRTSALKGHLWTDVAQAALRLAAATADATQRARHYHFAGVAQMDKALIGDQAIVAFRKALEADPSHKDSFVRLRILLEEDAKHDELAVLLKNRLEVEPQLDAKLELHRALAELHRNFLDSRDLAKHYYREILAAEPNDLRAHAAIADIAWEQGNWQEAADALIARARLEREPTILSTLCYRLGLIYADRINDPAMALRAFQRALTYQPDDVNTLIRLVDLASMVGEWQLALGACERLVANEQDVVQRVAHLHRVAKVLRLGFGDVKRAERALNLALDSAPTSDEALAHVVQFYREAGDMTSVRVHVNRVIGAMRARLHSDLKDGVAYRVIARAMAARDAAGVPGSLAVSYAAAELASRFGAAGEFEQRVIAEPRVVQLASFTGTEADDVLFPREVAAELRQMFRLLGDRVTKHIGVDLRMLGAERSDRLRADASAVAAAAQDVATALGLGEIEVYISNTMPVALIAEPTSPWSLIIGRTIAEADAKVIRFAAGAALKLAQAGLATAARLEAKDLGSFLVGLLRLFQPEFPGRDLDEATIVSHSQKLRRSIPAGLMNELRPFALAIGAADFRYDHIADGIHAASLRAGLIASGSITAGLGYLAARLGPEIWNRRETKQLVEFAVSEDHANLAR